MLLHMTGGVAFTEAVGAECRNDDVNATPIADIADRMGKLLSLSGIVGKADCLISDAMIGTAASPTRLELADHSS